MKFRILALPALFLLFLLTSIFLRNSGFYNRASFIGYTQALALSSDPTRPEPFILTDEQNKYPLGLHLEILEDPSGELTIEQVSSPEFDSKFTPSQIAVPNYGFTDSAYWVRLNLRNESLHTEHWLLEQGFANTHYIDLYTPLPDGGGYSVRQTGVLRPNTSRDFLYPRIVLSLDLPTGSQQTYYLRFQNGASMTLPLTLWTQTAFMERAIVEQILTGIFYGVLIGLLFYNLFLLFSLWDLSYFYLAAFLTIFILHEAPYDGYLAAYFDPAPVFFKTYSVPGSFSLAMALIVLFSDSFLEIKAWLPKLHRVNLVILAG